MDTSSVSQSHTQPFLGSLPPSQNEESSAQKVHDIGLNLVRQPPHPSIAAARAALPPFLDELTMGESVQRDANALVANFFDRSDRRPLPQAPMLDTEAFRLLIEFQRQNDASCQNFLLTALWHLWKEWDENISQKTSRWKPLEREVTITVIFSFIYGLQSMCQYIQVAQMDETPKNTSPNHHLDKQYRMHVFTIAKKIPMLEEFRRLIISRPDYCFEPIFNMYDACWSLFLQNPKALFFSDSAIRRIGIPERASFLAKLLHQILEMNSKIAPMIPVFSQMTTRQDKCPPSDSCAGDLHGVDTGWFDGVRSLSKLLSNASSNNQEDWERCYRLLRSKYDLVASRQGFSPSGIDSMHDSNPIISLQAQQIRKSQPDEVALSASAQVMDPATHLSLLVKDLTIDLMNSKYWLLLDQSLDLIVDHALKNRTAQTPFPLLVHLLNLYREKMILKMKNVESEDFVQLLRIVSGVPESDPLYPYILNLSKHIQQSVIPNNIQVQLWVQISDMAQTQSQNGRPPHFAWLVHRLYTGLGISQNSLKEIVDEFERFLSFQTATALPDDGSSQQAAIAAIIELSDWCLGNLTLDVKMLTHLIDKFWSIVGTLFDVEKVAAPANGSDWLPKPVIRGTKKPATQASASTSIQSTKTAVKKDKIKSKKSDKTSTQPEQSAVADDLSVHAAEKPPSIERIQSGELTPASLPDDIGFIEINLHPSVLYRCVDICQIRAKNGGPATPYLTNTQVFLQVFQELTHLPPTPRNRINRLDAMRRALENVIRALLVDYGEDSQEMTHNLRYLTDTLIELNPTQTVLETLERARPFINWIAHANEAIYYPLSSPPPDQRLAVLVQRSLEGDEAANNSLEKVATTGLDLLFNLLQAEISPQPAAKTAFRVPRWAPKGKAPEPAAQLADSSVSTAEAPSLLCHVRSSGMATLVIDQLQSWCIFIATTPAAIGATKERDIRLTEARQSLAQLQEAFKITEPGIHQVRAGLDFTRRALKALLQASLYHNGINDFDPHENNPRVLAQRLGKGSRALPKKIGCVHGVITSPAVTPFRSEEEDFFGFGKSLCELSAVSLRMGADPDQDSYRIQGKTITPEGHKERLMMLWTTAQSEMIFPCLSYLAELARKGF